MTADADISRSDRSKVKTTRSWRPRFIVGLLIGASLVLAVQWSVSFAMSQVQYRPGFMVEGAYRDGYEAVRGFDENELSCTALAEAVYQHDFHSPGTPQDQIAFKNGCDDAQNGWGYHPEHATGD